MVMRKYLIVFLLYISWTALADSGDWWTNDSCEGDAEGKWEDVVPVDAYSYTKEGDDTCYEVEEIVVIGTPPPLLILYPPVLPPTPIFIPPPPIPPPVVPPQIIADYPIWIVGKCERPLAGLGPLRILLPNHHGVYVQKKSSATDSVLHQKGFFAVDMMGAATAFVLRRDTGRGVGVVDGEVRMDYEAYTGCEGGSAELRTRYVEVHVKMDSAEYNWQDYHIKNRSCQHWAEAVLR